MNNCSICGWAVAWCVDKEDKGTYWLCGRCAVDNLRDKIPQQRSLVSVARATRALHYYARTRDYDGMPVTDLVKKLDDALKELPEGLID